MTPLKKRREEKREVRKEKRREEKQEEEQCLGACVLEEEKRSMKKRREEHGALDLNFINNACVSDDLLGSLWKKINKDTYRGCHDPNIFFSMTVYRILIRIYNNIYICP